MTWFENESVIQVWECLLSAIDNTTFWPGYCRSTIEFFLPTPVKHCKPILSAKVWYNKIKITVEDWNRESLAEKILNFMDGISIHEIRSKSWVHSAITLRVCLRFKIEKFLSKLWVEEIIKSRWIRLVITVDIINIQIFRIIDAHIKIEVWWSDFVERSVDGFLRLFSDLHTFIILLNRCEIVEKCVFTERSNYVVGNSEPIDNASTSEIECIAFFKDTSTDLWDILSCIRLT